MAEWFFFSKNAHNNSFCPQVFFQNLVIPLTSDGVQYSPIKSEWVCASPVAKRTKRCGFQGQVGKSDTTSLLLTGILVADAFGHDVGSLSAVGSPCCQAAQTGLMRRTPDSLIAAT